MSAIDNIIIMAEDLGLETDDVCEAIAYLGNHDEIDRWNLDEIYGEDVSVTSSGSNWLRLKKT